MTTDLHTRLYDAISTANAGGAEPPSDLIASEIGCSLDGADQAIRELRQRGLVEGYIEGDSNVWSVLRVT